MNRLGKPAFRISLLLLLAVEGLSSAAMPQLRTPSEKELEAAKREGETSYEQFQKEEKRKAEFLIEFLHSPPAARVQVWKDASKPRRGKELAYSVAGEVNDLLVMEGADAAPYFAALVRDKKEPFFFRHGAMIVLSQMDRYLTEESIPRGYSIYVPHLKKSGGAVSPFLYVTGRRIGKEAYETFIEGLEQSENEELRFHARELLGLVDKELEGSSTNELIALWRDAVAQAKGGLGSAARWHETVIKARSESFLLERAQEALPKLINLLESDQNPFVRQQLVFLILHIDRLAVRLRRIETGRQAIEAVRRALTSGNFKPELKTREQRTDFWQEFSTQVFNDQFRMDAGSYWAFVADTLEELYGEKTTRPAPPPTLPGLRVPVSEFQAFVTFLTDQDANFPSWEYIFDGHPRFHPFAPRFRAKMDRLHEEWILFNRQRVEH